MSSKEKEAAMLCEALARLRRSSSTLEDLIKADATADDLVLQIADLSYAMGQVQGASAVFIPRHGRRPPLD